MKHLVFIGVLLASCFAHAERYIVRNPQGLVLAEEAQVLKTLPSGSLVMDIDDEKAQSLSAKGFAVEKDQMVHVMGAPAILGGALPMQIIPWGIEAVKAPEAWMFVRNNHIGEGITVCVVDTGVDAAHPDLQGQVIGGTNTITNGNGSYADDMGHGTHVSGTIAALNNGFGVVGVAPGAKIYAIKVLGADGSGYDSDVAAGVRACIGHGQIINMSLGGSGSTQEMADAVKAAQDAGIIVVAAAGNEATNAIDYPAAYPGVKAVTAVDQTMKLGNFSNYANGVSFAAPGVNVTSTTMDGGYEAWNGTSMATPHVAGAYAAALACKKSVLKTDDIKLRPDQQGQGLPNLLKTIR